MADSPSRNEGDPNTHKTVEDAPRKAKPEREQRLNAVGQPEPLSEQPVQRHYPDRAVGERQDGPGIAPPPFKGDDAAPSGSSLARRGGANQGQPEEPDAAHRGQPARFANGAAEGSGAGAGGTRQGRPEDLDTETAGGAAHEGGLETKR